MDNPRQHGDPVERLGAGLAPGPLAYVSLLHPNQGERFRVVLANLKEISFHLRDDQEGLRHLIRHSNWRYTIVGCSSVLLLGDDRFREDLLESFLSDSWITPQLAVALGLLHGDWVSTVFEELLVKGNFRNRATSPKTVSSAYAVLRHLNLRKALDFEGGELFRQSQLGDAGSNLTFYARVMATENVNQYWDYWRSNVGTVN